MSDDRKKSLWPWIVALLVGLPLLYVASFGPACWLVSRMRTGEGALALIYRPMVALMVIDDSPAELKRRLSISSGSSTGDTITITSLFFYPRGYVSKYAVLGAADNWKWRFEAPVGYAPDPVVRMDEGRWKWFRDGM